MNYVTLHTVWHYYIITSTHVYCTDVGHVRRRRRRKCCKFNVSFYSRNRIKYFSQIFVTLSRSKPNLRIYVFVASTFDAQSNWRSAKRIGTMTSVTRLENFKSYRNKFPYKSSPNIFELF